MKFKFCVCELKGMTRPQGPVQIKRTKVLEGGHVMRANLSGAVQARVGVVKEGQKYFFVAPRRLGGVQEIPADSLTDALHASVDILNEKAERRALPRPRKGRGRARKAK